MPTPLHPSLRVRTNLVMLPLWFAGLVVALALLRLQPWPVALYGATEGLVQGLLQLRVMNAASGRLRAARSLLDIRAVMMSTRAGKAQIGLLWLSGAVMVSIGVTLATAHVVQTVIIGFAAGKFAEMLVREAVTLGGCWALEQEATLT